MVQLSQVVLEVILSTGGSIRGVQISPAAGRGEEAVVGSPRRGLLRL